MRQQAHEIKALAGFPKAGLGKSLVLFLSDIKLAHSLFALPFAGVGMLMAGLSQPSWQQLGLLLICMLCARSFAMGINRFADHKLDAKNPRTAQRLIPRGQLAAGRALFWSLAMGAGFIVATLGLNSLAALYSLPLLGILALYSYMKRFSWLCHWYLGLCLGLAPVAVSIALLGFVKSEVLGIGFAVMMWTAGFDILYALQDVAFDRQHGLKSVPACFGVGVALWASRLSFALMLIALTYAGISGQRGGAYFGGVLLVGAILAYEHWLVRDSRLNGCSRYINLAFFNLNAWVSILFFLMVMWDQWAN